ncbi:MAG: phytoene/squalene synthase family protein [Crocinitomicaceae bacterium]|jgi:phytoene/squalene synthetase|nr:phytoene/squalene synthase family protein [Crocinitomicaceae bacterium]
MDALKLYDRVCAECSVLTTKAYSTSFSLGIRFLGEQLRQPVYSIYGYVRFADEIVDTFHHKDKSTLFERFKADTNLALEEGISLNPILHAFQQVFHQYSLDKNHVDLFLQSMEWDLKRADYDRVGFEQYIVGSAEVVGLMCLKVFVNGDQSEYERLRPFAERLGAAFQKINFLRDIKADFQEMGRSYFPNLDMTSFDEQTKSIIEDEIEADFKEAYKGIIELPRSSRLGVYIAYIYYLRLFQKIRSLPSERIMEERIRIPNSRKATLFVGSYLRHSLNML